MPATVSALHQKVKEECRHIDKGRPHAPHQGELKMLYANRREKSLKGGTEVRTAAEVLGDCLVELGPKYPGAAWGYDRAFFGECG